MRCKMFSMTGGQNVYLPINLQNSVVSTTTPCLWAVASHQVILEICVSSFEVQHALYIVQHRWNTRGMGHCWLNCTSDGFSPRHKFIIGMHVFGMLYVKMKYSFHDKVDPDR